MNESFATDSTTPVSPVRDADDATDEALAAAAREDSRAVEALYERYARLHANSDAVAEDSVGDTMLAAMEGIERHDAFVFAVDIMRAIAADLLTEHGIRSVSIGDIGINLPYWLMEEYGIVPPEG